jgi:hypothetical protein
MTTDLKKVNYGEYVKTKLIFIRNTFTAYFANTILDYNDNVVGIAVIINPLIASNSDIYQSKIESILRLNNKWTEIIVLRKDYIRKSLWSSLLPQIYKIINFQKILISRVDYYKRLILKHRVSEVIICNPDDYLNEYVLIFAAYILDIEISAYSEVLHHKHLRRVFNKKLSINTCIATFIRKNLIHLFLINYSKSIKEFSSFRILNYKNIYGIFPEIDKRYNTSYHIEINPKFETSQLDIESVFITSSLSEDGLISIEEELRIIDRIILSLPNSTFIRFHPRDSLLKRKLILERTNLIELDLDIYAAENLLGLNSLKFLSGYITSTLFFASKIRPDIKIVSYIKYFEGKINMKVVEELKLDFPDIDFAIPSKS